MKSEKDEVSLVVEGGDLSANEVWLLWEKSSEQTADGVSQTRGEIVEDHLWVVFSWIFASSLRDKEKEPDDLTWLNFKKACLESRTEAKRKYSLVQFHLFNLLSIKHNKNDLKQFYNSLI